MPKRVAYQGTKVAIGRSMEDIRRLLIAYDAEGVNFGEDFGGGFQITFFYKKMPICLKFHIDGYYDAFIKAHPRSRRPDKDIREEAGKIMYRHAYNYLKTILEAVEFGLIEFESAFMAHFMGPNGLTLSEIIVPRLQDFASGKLLLEDKSK